MDFLEKRDAENLRDFAEAALDFQFFLQNRNQQVDADGDPELGLDGILGGSVKSLDPEILFDPFEEKLHLPTAFVELGNGESREHQIVGEEEEPLARFGVEVTYSPKFVGIVLGGVKSYERDCSI